VLVRAVRLASAVKPPQSRVAIGLPLVAVLVAAALSGCAATPKVLPSSTPTSAPHVAWSETTPAGPNDVIAAFGSIWEGNHHAESVVRIDPKTHKVLATLKTGPNEGQFFQGDGAVWVSASQKLYRLDGTTNVVSSIDAPNLCGLPAVVAGAVWGDDCDNGRLVKIDPATGTFSSIPTSRISSGGFVLVGSTLWVVEASPGALLEINPSTSAITSTIQLPGCPFLTRQGIIGGSLWISQSDDCDDNSTWSDQIAEVNLSSDTVTKTVHTNLAEPGIVSDATSAWVFSDSGQIEKLNTANGRLTPWTDLHATSDIGTEAAFGSIWTISFDDNMLWQIAKQ
jgi:hypothetical protein